MLNCVFIFVNYCRLVLNVFNQTQQGLSALVDFDPRFQSNITNQRDWSQLLSSPIKYRSRLVIFSFLFQMFEPTKKSIENINKIDQFQLVMCEQPCGSPLQFKRRLNSVEKRTMITYISLINNQKYRSVNGLFYFYFQPIGQKSTQF